VKNAAWSRNARSNIDLILIGRGLASLFGAHMLFSVGYRITYNTAIYAVVQKSRDCF